MGQETIDITTSEEKQQAVITWTSKYGSKIIWTVTADRSELRIHGLWVNDGKPTEDTVKLAPIDQNTVELFI